VSYSLSVVGAPAHGATGLLLCGCSCCCVVDLAAVWLPLAAMRLLLLLCGCPCCCVVALAGLTELPVIPAGITAPSGNAAMLLYVEGINPTTATSTVTVCVDDAALNEIGKLLSSSWRTRPVWHTALCCFLGNAACSAGWYCHCALLLVVCDVL